MSQAVVLGPVLLVVKVLCRASVKVDKLLPH
jgi:hypothetical protein